MRSGKGKGAGGPGCTHGGGHRRPLRRPPARKMSPCLMGGTCSDPMRGQQGGLLEHADGAHAAPADRLDGLDPYGDECPASLEAC